MLITSNKYGNEVLLQKQIQKEQDDNTVDNMFGLAWSMS